ncbi:MAG: DUF6691 family protein [Bacteroidota bacterium]
MRKLSYLLIGILFGVVMFKSEAASWFRIYEMFQFDSFHMYGIMGSALFLGMLFLKLIKRLETTSFFGETILIAEKKKSFWRYAIGGVVFGLGWALAGACPGPIYVLIGAGFWPVLLVLLGAILGALCYGVLRSKLPH